MRLLEWVRSGVTGYLCSLAAPDDRALIELVKHYVEALDAGVPGAEPLGIHLEGPFINKEKKGAFNPSWLRPFSGRSRGGAGSRAGLDAPDHPGA